MNAGARLAGYGLVLVAVLAAGAGLGAAVGPDDDTAPEAHDGMADLSFVVARTTYGEPGVHDVAFRIIDGDGEVVHHYDVEHDKEMHLIAVSQRLDAYAHVHPERDDAGVWRVRVPFDAAGPYRLYADFDPEAGEGTTLAADVQVAGDYEPAELPEPVRTVDAGDGFEVTRRGTPTANDDVEVTFEVTRDGRPVRVEPYLGASGHLVAISAADLAYLHVHPSGDDADRGIVRFGVETRAAGRYRMFFDFQVDGEVRTAAFTVDVAQAASSGDDEPGHGDEPAHEG